MKGVKSINVRQNKKGDFCSREKLPPNLHYQQNTHTHTKKKNREKETTGCVYLPSMAKSSEKSTENIKDTKNGRKEGHSKLLLKLQAWNSLRNSIQSNVGQLLSC